MHSISPLLIAINNCLICIHKKIHPIENAIHQIINADAKYSLGTEERANIIVTESIPITKKYVCLLPISVNNTAIHIDTVNKKGTPI
jgi:hypothetical protein